MGGDLFNALEFNITSAPGESISTVELSRYPNLTTNDTAMCTTGVKHKALIDPNLNPVAEPLPRVAIAYHGKTCKNLDDMEYDRVLIELEEWKKK